MKPSLMYVFERRKNANVCLLTDYEMGFWMMRASSWVVIRIATPSLTTKIDYKSKKNQTSPKNGTIPPPKRPLLAILLHQSPLHQLPPQNQNTKIKLRTLPQQQLQTHQTTLNHKIVKISRQRNIQKLVS